MDRWLRFSHRHDWDNIFGIDKENSVRFRWGGSYMESKTVGNITGALFWDDKESFYTQENNAIETYNKTQQKEGLNHWTESCGPTACINALAALGWFKNHASFHAGAWIPQPEDILFLYMNDPRNKELWELRKDIPMNSIPGNRIPQFYPKAVQELFNLGAAYDNGITWDKIKSFILEGRAIQICLKSPGHYVAIVAYDKEKDEIIYNDSFGSRFADGKGGFNRRMSKADMSNVQNYGIIYG